MNHTPGPWEAYVATWRGVDVVAIAEKQTELPTKRRLVCIITELASINKSDEANAKLIAAAPDLLEACSKLLEAIELGMNLPPAVKAAVLAISKAEGKEKKT